MPNRNNNRKKKPQAKQNEGSAQIKNGKQLGLALGSQLGSGLVKGIVPIVVGAVASAVTKMLPAPQGGAMTRSVSVPAAMGNVGKTGAPRTRTNSDGTMNVTHREYIADLLQRETGFDLQFQFGINPGNSSLFPWLSLIAARFDCYRFRYLRICYEQQTASTTTGTVMIAPDYDASDEPPANKQQMMSYKGAVRSVPWSDCIFEAASPDLHRLKTNYVLTGTKPPSTDIKTYDIGNLFIAVQTDTSVDASIGELYVEYSVDLITPQITGDAIPMAVLYSGEDSTGNDPFGPVPFLDGGLQIEVIPSIGGTDQQIRILQPGNYQIISLAYNATSNITWNPDVLVYNDFTVANTTVTNPGPFSTQSAQIQVRDQFTPAFSINASDLEDSPYYVLRILPLSKDCISNTSNTGPLPVTENPRARLGRRYLPSS